jgi:hypothetical protein
MLGGIAGADRLGMPGEELTVLGEVELATLLTLLHGGSVVDACVAMLSMLACDAGGVKVVVGVLRLGRVCDVVVVGLLRLSCCKPCVGAVGCAIRANHQTHNQQS